MKRARILGLGAKVVQCGAADQLAAIEGAAAFSREHGHYFLDDSSDVRFRGRRDNRQRNPGRGAATDTIFVPIGDTALIRGVAAEAKRRHPTVRIVGVQAEQAPAYARSWQQGRVVVTDTCDTIADGLATRHPSEAK